MTENVRVLGITLMPSSCADGQQELKALFTNVFPSYKVTSTKVLKDEQGISRGVGFVR